MIENTEIALSVPLSACVCASVRAMIDWTDLISLQVVGPYCFQR